jgi:hypothetical protein
MDEAPAGTSISRRAPREIETASVRKTRRWRAPARTRVWPSVLLGLCGGIALVVIGTLSGTINSHNYPTMIAPQPLALFALLPILLVVLWSVGHDWVRERRSGHPQHDRRRRLGMLVRHLLAIGSIAGALPAAAGLLLTGGVAAPLMILGLLLPGLAAALAAGFAFAPAGREQGGGAKTVASGQAPELGCLSAVVFLVAAGVAEGVYAAAVELAQPRVSHRCFDSSECFGALRNSFLSVTIGLVLGCLSVFLAPIAGFLGGFLRGSPPD